MSLQSASRRLRQELHCHDDERMQNLLNKKTSTFRFEVCVSGTRSLTQRKQWGYRLLHGPEREESDVCHVPGP